MRSAIVFAGAVLAVTNSTSGYAQTLQLGDRVRLTPAGVYVTTVTGTLAEIRGDTLVVARDSAGTDVARVLSPSLRSIERSVGRRSRLFEGAAWGGLIGAAVGTMLGYVSYDAPRPVQTSCYPEGQFFCPSLLNFDFGPGLNAAFGMAVGSLAGAVIGGIVGAHKSTDRWRRVTPLSESVGLRIGPSARGTSAVLSFAFGAPPGN
ncbi:MAG TPA: hypothetical protein VJR92_04465 [Gemmatimonadaceae bacterium]|nr:hypothetical protein [Gemmatimonadaceae bacterium]